MNHRSLSMPDEASEVLLSEPGVKIREGHRSAPNTRVQSLDTGTSTESLNVNNRNSVGSVASQGSFAPAPSTTPVPHEQQVQNSTQVEHVHINARTQQLGLIPSVHSNGAIERECLCASRRNKKKRRTMRISLRGVRFSVPVSTLWRRPESRLSTLTPSDPSFDPCTMEYSFDRNPTVFNSILDYYAHGEMHLPANVCMQAFRRELRFWRLEPELLAPCCWSRYRKAEEEERTLDKVQKEWGQYNPTNSILDNVGSVVSISKLGTMHRIWIFMNEPHTSAAAKVWSVFMILMIAISIAVLSLETVLDLRVGPPEFWEKLPNVTEKRLIFILENSDPHEALLWAELVTLIVLTAEFVARFVVCPDKRAFCRSLLNIADLIGIVPIWVMISLFFAEMKLEGREKGAIVFAYYFMMCLRLLRIFRLFKLVKHYKTLKILLLAVRASYRELLLLVILLTMGVVIYANLIYFVEVEYDNFMSIPEGFWWAIVTMTTVGYGDYYPKSGFGYLVGSLCAITGILVIALPVPVIANNFSTYYGMSLAWERMAIKEPKRRPSDAGDDTSAANEHSSAHS